MKALSDMTAKGEIACQRQSPSMKLDRKRDPKCLGARNIRRMESPMPKSCRGICASEVPPGSLGPSINLWQQMLPNIDTSLVPLLSPLLQGDITSRRSSPMTSGQISAKVHSAIEEGLEKQILMVQAEDHSQK